MKGSAERQVSRSGSLAKSPTNDEDDSDTISLTSTVEPEDPPDTEYVVEGVHAEREQEIDGQLQPLFLVEWANFPLDQCTWEPLENLPEELTNQWEEKKAAQDPAVALEFEDKYKAAFNAKLESARQRHRQRNAKRKRLGRPTTSFWFRGQQQSDSENEAGSADEIHDSDVEPFTHSSDGDSERDEADEDNAIDHKATEALVDSSKSSSKTKSPRPPRPASRVFTFDPKNSRSIEKKSANGKNKGAPLAKPSKNSTHSSSNKEPQNSQPSKRSGRDREVGSNMGYQGSARKSSTADSSSSRSVDSSALKAALPAPPAAPTHPAASTIPSTTVSSGLTTRTLTAKKTAAKTTQSIDIFSGGIKAKTKQSLGATEIDNNSAPKFYSKAKYRRMAELKARARADQAPDISQIADAVFAPGSNAGNAKSVSQEHVVTNSIDGEGGTRELREEPQEQPSTMPPTPFNGVSSATAGAIYKGAPKRSSLSSKIDRPSKKAKRVHFTEVQTGSSASQGPSAIQTRSERFREADDKWIPKEQEEELFLSQPMDIESTSGSSLDVPVEPPSSSAAGARRLSLSTYKSRNVPNVPSVQSVGKKLKLSTSPGTTLDVTFDGVPQAASVDAAQQWLKDFLSMNCVDIGHMVLAETFIAQLPSLSSQGFQPLCFGTITSSMNSEGLDIIAEHLRIGSSGLFKAQPCFNLLVFPTKCADFESLSNFGVEPLGPGAIALKYIIFRSANPIFQQIRPSSSTIQGLKARVGQEKVLLFPTALGIQYSALIASSDKDKKKPPHFFLAFPERSMEWQRSIASWLTTRERACKIYTNFEPGSWLAFVERAKRERGVVIIHEALVPFLRRFAQLAKLLLKYPVNIWHFSESLDLEQPQSLVGSNIVPAMSTKLTRLFPFGSVVLITPSFLVTEPQAAYKLFKWFFEVRAKMGNNKLVLAYDIIQYLNELSREKTAHRSRLDKELWMRKRPMDVAIERNNSALTDQDLEARQKTWLYMDWWLSQQVQSTVPFSDFNPAIFADRSIDPHDEQSLVNWFGWWSMQHSHEYRKFYVLGSSSETGSGSTHRLTSRFARKVLIPRYERSIVNDPDEAMRVALSEQGPSSAKDSEFQSQCFHNDENEIKPWLETQDKGFFAKLYRFPVSWVDARMAAESGDHETKHFRTVGQWWDSVQSWTSGTPKNTYIGFFYTTSEKWNPNKSDGPVKPRRHPWLAIWRPVDPHLKGALYSHGKTELIIWDVRAGVELEANLSVQLKNLTWMQQALVSHIQIHAHEKNPGSFLERVWLGGYQVHQAPFISPQPADITAEFLMRLIRDLTHTLAAARMYLQQSGYRQVTLPGGLGPPGTFHEEQSDDDADTRIIFHPPRGSGHLQPKGSSKCINELFEVTRLERLRFGHGKDMVYTYSPTLTWYQKQVAEGRHFEHILVDEWDKVFSVMGVDKATSAPPSVSDDRAIQASRRRGSGSSTHSSTTH